MKKKAWIMPPLIVVLLAVVLFSAVRWPSSGGNNKSGTLSPTGLVSRNGKSMGRTGQGLGSPATTFGRQG
jgi:hypothetical protein